MEQSSNDYFMEDETMMNSKEVARAIEYLRLIGLTDKQICDFLTYVGTGAGISVENADSKDE